MDGTGRAESGTEAESNAWSSCRERSETQQTHPPAPPLPPAKVLGFTSFNPTYGYPHVEKTSFQPKRHKNRIN